MIILVRVVCVISLDEPGGVHVANAGTTQSELAEAYDATFCLAVLCRGDLTTSGAKHCDPHLRFANFERTVVDFARCLKAGGLLLHTTNFRLCDTIVASEFEPVLEAGPAQLAPDVLFDRDDKLMPGARYRTVGFRKRGAALLGALDR